MFFFILEDTQMLITIEIYVYTGYCESFGTNFVC